MSAVRNMFIDLSRWTGRQVCRIRGHRYYYAGGAFCSDYAYGCIRCGELDRPLDSLPERTLDEDGYYDEPYYDEEIDREEFNQARRWFSWLPYPKWL